MLMLGYLCSRVSFMTLASVSYERFVAVRLQARYNNVFSSKRVLMYMATIWIVNILLTSLQWAGIKRISGGMHLIAWFICVLVAGDANIAIALTLLRTRRRVQPQHEPLRNKICRRRETKLTRIIAFVVGAYLLLNMSVFLSQFITRY